MLAITISLGIRIILKLFFIIVALTASSCSIAPLAQPKSADSLEKGQYSVEAGFAPSPYARIIYGATKKLDLALGYEYQGIGQVFDASVKYTAYQEREYAAAMNVAGFKGELMSGFSVSPIVSYRGSFFEFYLTTAYNEVYWSASLKSKDLERLEELIFEFIGNSLIPLQISYLQTSLGANMWFSDHFAINLSLSHFKTTSHTNRIDFQDIVLPALALISRF